MEKLATEKKSAIQFVERRYSDWDENYELNRNKVKTNRLTQRQAVNIPLMKETLKTLLSKIDEPPMVDWKELGGDKDKELVFQEIWNADYERLNMEAIDIQDKKTVLLYGRSFKKLNWIDDQIDIRALDIYDVIVDPLTDPLDLETARFVIHQNIFRSLRDILANDRYTQKGKDALKVWLTSQDAIVQTSSNKEELEKKNERLKSMGVDDESFALFSGGDVVINLTEHYTNVWNTSKKAFERRVIVYAQDSIELLNETLMDLIGVDFWPFSTWGDDIETQDFWSDAVADLVRVPNKIVNIWFSQLVENRTLRNFQMHWYDATVEGYQPQTYEPGPGRMLPAPGDPTKTIKPVEISGLDETLTAIQFLTGVIERGTSATAIEKGEAAPGTQTLGEIEILVGKAQERVIAMAKFYRRSWQDLAMKYYQMLNANESAKRTLYKTGRDGNIWPKTVYDSDWKSKAGYRPEVRSTSEQEQSNTKEIQKFMLIQQRFPNNAALNRIMSRRMLELVDLTPDEIREIEEGEKQAQLTAQQQPMQAQPTGQQPVPTPMQLPTSQPMR